MSAIEGIERPARPERLLERDVELDRLDRLAESAARGEGATVVIEGPAGVGKTRLLTAAGERWRERGLQVLTARGGELERELPWSAIREIFEPAIRDARPDGAIRGAARLAEPVLRPKSGPAGADPAAAKASAFHGLYWLAANLSERLPLVLVLDDYHWADPPSLEFLAYLEPRIADLRVLLAVAGRPREPGADEMPIDRIKRGAVVLRPAALSKRATEELVAEALGRPPDPELTAACVEATAGNPFLLGELCIELAREEGPTATDAARVREVSSSAIANASLLRIAALGDEAVRVAYAVAILTGSPTSSLVASVAGVAPARTSELVDALTAMEVLAPAPPVEFAHPLVRSAVYGAIPALERARTHAVAARVLAVAGASASELAAHLLMTEPGTVEGAAATLATAARTALASGAPERAVLCLRRAMKEPMPGEERQSVLVELAEAEAVAGDADAVDRLRDALELVADAPERARIRLRLGWLLCRVGRISEGSEVLAEAVVEIGGADEELRRELELAYAANAWQDASHASRARDAQNRLLDVAPGEPRTPQDRALLAQRALAVTLSGESRDAAVSDAMRSLGEGALIEAESSDSITGWVAIGCLSWSDALAEAEAAIDVALGDAQRRGSPIAMAWGYYARSWPRYWMGRIDESIADAAAAIDGWSGSWEMYLPAAKYWLAMGLVERDELERAEAALELQDEQWSGTSMYALWRAGRGRLEMARGNWAGALAELQAAAKMTVESFGIANPAILPWRSESAVCHLRLGDRERARDLAEEELGLARRFGAARPIGIALRASGIVRGGADGIALLDEAVSVLEGSASELELCRALVDLGALLRRGRERARARTELRRALDLAHRLGARVLEDRARDELLRTGARPRRELLAGPGSLTPSERRVAELAAEGRTNREIAELLFVSLRTVETHLTHAYGKLGISSRRGLAGSLSPRKARGRDHDANGVDEV